MKLIKAITVTALLLACQSLAMFAQNREVSGTVLDSQNLPIIGAAVIVANSPNIGIVTDTNGEFTLNVPEGEVVLEVSCLGYTTQTITVSATRSMSSAVASLTTPPLALAAGDSFEPNFGSTKV